MYKAFETRTVGAFCQNSAQKHRPNETECKTGYK